MSLGAWHRYAGVHLPPWQLVEQHSGPVAHASPRVLQALVPEGAARAWQVVAQLPVQHSCGPLHAAAVGLQEVFAQRPLTQESEQHSPESAQAPPGALQKAVVVHLPALQAPEQHWPFEVQVPPEAPQVETGVAQSCDTGLQ